MKKIRNFFKNVRNEMHKVRWSNKKEMAIYSIATISCILVFSLFFTGLDFLISFIKEVIH